MLLKKGFEVEQYTGSKDGQLLPLSAIVSRNLPEFSLEPDQRNIELITPALTSYEELLSHAIKSRMKLRNFLSSQNPDWTIVPCSCPALPFEQEFIFSKPEDQYHQHINERHGLSVITTSIHYNIGIDDPKELIRLVNLLRLEAPLILAMSASSPFYNGEVTGNHSQRWLMFPKVPEFIPFFQSHEHYINWNNRMIEEGYMYNVRHFWGAVRPNGTNRPYNINRLEIRISDLCTRWQDIMALLAWIELRVQYFLQNPEIEVSAKDEGLVSISDHNEILASMTGLSAHFSDWLYQEETLIYDAFEKRMEDNRDLARQLGIENLLKPLETILANGNESTRKLEKISEGYSLNEVMQGWVQESLEEDLLIEASHKASY